MQSSQLGLAAMWLAGLRRTTDHFAAYDGSAPIEVSSGPKKIYRLSMRGSRQLNHALHMTAVTWPWLIAQ